MKREIHEQEMSELEDAYIELVRQLEIERDKYKADTAFWKRKYQALTANTEEQPECMHGADCPICTGDWSELYLETDNQIALRMIEDEFTYDGVLDFSEMKQYRLDEWYEILQQEEE